jgi:hypothetical protein
MYSAHNELKLGDLVKIKADTYLYHYDGSTSYVKNEEIGFFIEIDDKTMQDAVIIFNSDIAVLDIRRMKFV